MRGFRWIVILMGLALAAYALSGVFTVAPGEVAVVRRLGRVLPRSLAPGLHWGWPAGLDRVARVRTTSVRRLEVGFVGAPAPDTDPDSGEYMSGDLNFLRARGIVQYRVADPVAFTLRMGEIEPLLSRMAEASLSRALARLPIDATLRAGRAEVAAQMESDLARSIARYQLGIAILSVSLTDARPPSEVAPDFAAAQAAQSERDRRIRQATTYETTTLIAAKAAAGAKIEEARSRADRSLALTKARVSRFVALLGEAGSSRRLTVRRIYLETFRELWPKVRRKLVMTPEESVDLSLFENSAEPVKGTPPAVVDQP